MDRLIVTGPNGAGKTHLARELGALRPSVPIHGFDAMKLARGWERRPGVDATAALKAAIGGDRWILEGGPSLLPHALPRADAVVWLDPPLLRRGWRLLLRPWRHLGRTRPELPPGNPDWPLRQYRFAWASLRADTRFRTAIETALGQVPDVPVWHLRESDDRTALRAAWRGD